MSTTSRKRTEAGFSTLSTLVGAALGAMVIGGFILFWSNADNASQQNAENSRQGTAAVTALNRAGRDVAEARTFVENKPDEFVVEKVTANPDRTQVVTRTRYAVEPRVDERTGKTSNVLVRQVQIDAPGVYDPEAPFVADSEQVLGRNVRGADSPEGPGTTFEYRAASGATTTTPSQVGRVDITYVAATKGGAVELKSTASVNNAIGGNGQRGGADGSLDADEDQITIIAGQSGVADVLSNDTYGNAPVVSLVTTPSPLTATVTPGGVSIAAPAGVTVPTVYTITYRLSDASGGSATSTIRVAVKVPLNEPTVTWNDICYTDRDDSYVLPPLTGMRYFVSEGGAPAVEKNAGEHFVTGDVAVQVSLKAVTDRPAPGYVINHNGTFTVDVDNHAAYNFQHMPCSLDSWASSPPSSQGDADGVNTISWSGGFLEYQRVEGDDPNSNNATSWTRLPAANNSLRSTVTHVVRFGTQYQYRVVKTRNTVVDTVTSRPNGLLMQQGTSGRPGTLQYPLVPAISAANAGAENNTVSGLNTGGIVSDVDLRILQSYRVDNAVYLRDASYVENVSGTYTHTDAGRGTEQVYFGVAQSRCRVAANTAETDCYSFGGGDTASALVDKREVYTGNGIARAYQAPILPPDGVVGGVNGAGECYAGGVRTVNNDPAAAGARNSLYHCASNQANITWADDQADHGMPADSKFCDYPGDPGGCYVVAQRPGGSFQERTTPMLVSASQWGAHDLYRVAACNVAGCSTNTAPVDLFAYPGTFSVNAVLQPEARRHKDLVMWADGNCWSTPCADVKAGEARAEWSRSQGVNEYVFQGGREGRAESIDYGTGTTTHSGFFGVDPIKHYYFRAVSRGAHLNLWRRTSTGGKADVTFMSSPPHVSYVQDSPFCAAAEDRGWQYGFWYKKQAIGPLGAEIHDDVPLQVRHMWWTKKMAKGSGDQVGVTAAPYWRAAANNPSSFADPRTWTVGMEPYFGFSGNTDMDGSWTKVKPGAIIPPLPTNGSAGGAAHLRIEVFVTKTDAGSPDFADLRYWDGGNSESTHDSQITGSDIRVRAEDVGATQVTACSAVGNAAHGWSGGTHQAAWYAVASGQSVTRRYADSSRVTSRSSPAALGWSQVE